MVSISLLGGSPTPINLSKVFIMKYVIASTLLVAVLSTAAMAADQQSQSSQNSSAGSTSSSTTMMPSFQQLDTNQDGYISQSEINAYPQLRDRWNEMNLGSQGRIGRDEFSRFESQDGTSGGQNSKSGQSSGSSNQSGSGSTNQNMPSTGTGSQSGSQGSQSGGQSSGGSTNQ